MVDEDLGEAVIVYDDAKGEATERTVQNEHIAYFQDHWILKTGEDDEGRDVVRRIPLQRVHYVERSVEEFEEEVSTLRSQVESFADDLRSKFFDRDDTSQRHDDDVTRIDVESGEDADDRDDSR